MAKPIITVKNLRKYYYQYKVFFKGKLLTKALQGLSFTIKEGDFVGLIGVNGAGKSTLMRILTTNMHKDSGSVHVAGLNMDTDQEEIKEKISWMFGQDFIGISWASLEKNMQLAAAFIGLDKHEAQQRIDMLLKKFSLEEKRHTDVWRLSTGMSAKYSLAVALLKQPKILFLDEPLLGLDTYAKDEIRSILKELNAKGTTIIYTDHQLHEVEKVCKRLLIINKGKMIFDGTTRKLKKVYREARVLDVVCSGKNIDAVLHKLWEKKVFADYEILDSERHNYTVRIFTSQDSKKILPKVTRALHSNKISIEHINAGVLGLEDVYRKFMGGDEKKTPIGFLGKVGKKTLADFQKVLRHSDPARRSQRCDIFWKRHKRKVQPLLLKMLVGSKEMQTTALEFVGHIKDPCFMEHVLEALEERDVALRNKALLTLAKMGNETVVDSLLDMLLHEEFVTEILEEVPHFDDSVLGLLQEKIVRISAYDRAFLLHHAKRSDTPNALVGMLHLENKYAYKRRRKGRKAMN